VFNADAMLEIAHRHGLPPFADAEPEPGDMPTLAQLQAADAAEAYAAAHDADLAAMTADSPWYAGGVYYHNPEDAAIVRQRLQARAARDAARFAADAERMAQRERRDAA
jgi:hypothetical protein